MRRTPDISYPDVPYTVLELAHLSNIHPAPVLSHFDLVVRTDLDPLAVMGPYRDLHLILPVIDDFKEATGLIREVHRVGDADVLCVMYKPQIRLTLTLYFTTSSSPLPPTLTRHSLHVS
jgi:hypothetical protein